MCNTLSFSKHFNSKICFCLKLLPACICPIKIDIIPINIEKHETISVGNLGTIPILQYSIIIGLINIIPNKINISPNEL